MTIRRCLGLLPTWTRPWQQVMVKSAISWMDHRATSKRAALAFYALFSMTPILMFAIAMAGYLFGTTTTQAEVISQLQQLIGPNGAQAVVALLMAAEDPVSGLLASLLASLILLLGTTGVFVELKGSLDEMWGIEQSRQLKLMVLMETRLVSFALVMVLGLCLMITMVSGSALALLETQARTSTGSWSAALNIASSLISFCLITGLFALIYKTLPEAPLSWRDVCTGAAFTAGLFSLGKFLIGLYLSKSGIASGFGATGSLIALLLWVYYSAQTFFFGAEFTRQYALCFGSLRDKADGPAWGGDRSRPN